MLIWEVSLDGTGLHRLLPGGTNSLENECCGRWTADGKYFLFRSRGQVWALFRKAGFFRNRPKPIQLTFSPLEMADPTPSIDGKKLFVVGVRFNAELMRYDVKSSQFLPFMGGIPAEFASFSKDGQWVAYVSYPNGALWRSKVDGSERLQLTYPPSDLFPPSYAFLPRWSPDGKTIVFFEADSHGVFKIYELSADGMSPHPLMADDQSQQTDPNWSPDGNKIVFGGAWNDPASTIRILDLKTHQVDTLPGSQGLFSPRWSPDGRYIPALSVDSTRLLLFDFQTRKWIDLAEGRVGWQEFSHDGRYLQFLDITGSGSVWRIRLSDGKKEQVVDLKDFVTAGRGGSSLAIAPDDSPLLLRDSRTQDIYSLDWEEP
jgi:Tol biopolymer transport system component